MNAFALVVGCDANMGCRAAIRVGTIRDDQEGITRVETMILAIGENNGIAARITSVLSAFIEYEFRDTAATQVRHWVRHLMVMS